MKQLLKFTVCILIIGAGAFASCKKENLDSNANGGPEAACDTSNRAVIKAQLVPFGTLSQGRTMINVGAAGTKILFAGGYSVFGESARVDIYDVVTKTWSTAELSKPRVNMGVATLGNKIFFAGGENHDTPPDDFASNVDIYDASTNTWSVAYLSIPRTRVAAAAVGNKVFFAGGTNNEGFDVFNRIDIYDISTDSWSTATLSEARDFPAAVTVGNKIYFAGGTGGFPFMIPTNRIEIYDNATDSWSISTLNMPKSQMACIAAGDKIFWAGGATSFFLNSSGLGEFVATNSVEIRDVSTQSTTFECLSRPNTYWHYGSFLGAVLKEDNIVFYNGFGAANDDINGDGLPKMDIYNMTTDTWRIGSLNQYLGKAAIISVNNTIYAAGGEFLSGTDWKYIDQVWKLEF